MGTPVAADKARKRYVRSWDDVHSDGADGEDVGRTGRALLGVVLVGLALWAAIIFAIRLLIAAL